MPNTKYQNTKYQIPNAKYQIPKYQVPNTKYQNTKYSRPWNAVNSQKIPLTKLWLAWLTNMRYGAAIWMIPTIQPNVTQITSVKKWSIWTGELMSEKFKMIFPTLLWRPHLVVNLVGFWKNITQLNQDFVKFLFIKQLFCTSNKYAVYHYIKIKEQIPRVFWHCVCGLVWLFLMFQT